MRNLRVEESAFAQMKIKPSTGEGRKGLLKKFQAISSLSVHIELVEA